MNWTPRTCIWPCILAGCGLLPPIPFAHGVETETHDKFGGIRTGRFTPGKYFRLEREGPRWWLVTPEGGAFLSFGVNHITSQGDRIKDTDTRPYRDNILAKHGAIDKWAKTVHNRLKEWNFNTQGAWSTGELNDRVPRTPILSLTKGYWAERWQGGRVPDFFGSEFLQHVKRQSEQIEQHAGDPYVIGYFIDNELPWAPDHRHTPELFDGYLAMPAEAAGKHKLADFFKERYGTVEEFNKVWEPKLHDWSALRDRTKLSCRNKTKAKADREAFTLLVAREYFRVTTEAIRAKDPGRLILGCRFIPQTVPKVVVRACGEYCDVVSINFYETAFLGRLYFWCKPASIDRMPQEGDLSAYHEIGKNPLMVTEFSFRAMDSGMPNTYPPGYAVQPTVKTQKDRAAKYEHYVMAWLAQPYFVGAHWFEYADEPKEGRSDGEDGNYGLVNIEDEPYEEFVNAVAEIIPRAWKAHAEAGET